MKCCTLGTKEEKSITRVSEELGLLAEPNRLRILCLLKKHEQCVCDIFASLNLPQNLVSHHLKLLRDAGLVTSRREGTRIVYMRNETAIQKLHRSLANILPL